MNLAHKRMDAPIRGPGPVGEDEGAPEDEDLVALAQDGDKQAFAQLMTRHQHSLRALAYHATGSWDLAEDLSQEAMFCAWTHLSTLKDPRKFQPWLSTIVRNSARNWRRHQGRHAPRAQHSIDTLEKLPSQAPTPLEEVQSREAVSIARQAIAGLSARYREALLLFFSLGESHAEVASALGLSEVNARQRLTRARKKLRGEIADIKRCGKRIGATSSSAAAIVLALGTREALASKATTLSLGTSVNFLSAKLLVVIGAIGGAALVACIVLVVSLMNSGHQNEAPLANVHGADAELGESLVENRGHSARSQTVSPARATPARVTPSRVTPRADSPLLRGTVRIGNGKAQKPKTLLPLSPTKRSPSQVSGESEPVAGNARVRANRSVRAAKGGLKKHGPAVLRRDEKTKSRSLLKPSIDINDFLRESSQ